MTTTRNADRSAETRARLLSAAVSTFAAKGFHGTTTRDIARVAGISPTGLYVHHESKEELLYLISHEGHEEALRIVREAIAAEPGPLEQIRRVVYDFVIHHAKSHESSRVVNYELAALDPEHLAEILGLRKQIALHFRSVIDFGADQGVFDVPNRRMTANALMSMGIDIARWYRDDGVRPEEIAEAYANIALRSVAPGAAID